MPAEDVFQAAIDRTIAALPEKFRKVLEGVVIIVKDEPDDPEDADLLGLYEGDPITEWDRDYSGRLPDTITLFRLNIEDEADYVGDLDKVIKETLLHEIAHHLGYEHDKIDVWEERWAGGTQQDV